MNLFKILLILLLQQNNSQSKADLPNPQNELMTQERVVHLISRPRFRGHRLDDVAPE